MNQVQGAICIMGCGDIGRRVARLYQQENIRVMGWVNSKASQQLGLQQGIDMQVGDMDGEEFRLPAPVSTQAGLNIFWFMPPPKQGVQDQRLRRFLAWVKDMPSRMVLISTTGVYGDCQGRWVNEQTPVNPQTERAKRRIDAEQALQAWGQQYGKEWIILRVPGIYAAERLPLERLRCGEPIIRAEESPWTNRIHADDLAMIAKAAMQSMLSREIYNATDGNPLTMTDYFNQVADYAGLPHPPQIGMAEARQQLSAGMLCYLQESRRITNQKLVAELAIQLRYPNLAAGLAGVPNGK